MAKFNQHAVSTTVNLAGGKAYNLSNKEKLVTAVLTTFFGEPKYYGDNSSNIVLMVRECIKYDPKFVANLALYAREQFYLRSISHVIAAELAANVKGEPWVRSVVARVVQRPDDMKEILAYYLAVYGKPIANSLKKGLADAFAKFDEYGLAKYNGGANEIKLRDILCIAHPKPATLDQAVLWKKVLESTLEVPVTWETQLSAHGNKPEVWDRLIADRNLGYMALLRNLRNIVQSKATNLDQALSYLQNEKAVANSKQFPFRFLSAYRELQKVNGVYSTDPQSYRRGYAQPVNGTVPQKVFDAIETALRTSVANVPHFDGTTFFTADNSGSMGSMLSDRGSVSYADVANLMMATSQHFCDQSILSVFGDSFATVEANKFSSIFDIMEKIRRTDVGHSTYLYKSIKWLVDNKVKVDRIVIFSDMQAYTHGGSYWGGRGESTQSLLNEYRQKVNSNVWVHSVDLAGYGTSAIDPHGKVNLLAGWSDKVLSFIPLVEQGGASLVEKVATYANF